MIKAGKPVPKKARRKTKMAAPAKMTPKMAGPANEPKTVHIAKPRGRPTLRTEAIEQAIIAGISDGIPLTVICRREGMPGYSTVRGWIGTDPAFSSVIACAREEGFDVIAADILRIADTPMEGVIEKLEPDKKTGKLVVVERCREDMLGHRRLQIETRFKLLAKWDPKRYGEKLDVELTLPDVSINLNLGGKPKEQRPNDRAED